MVNKATLISDIWNSFYNIIINDVTDPLSRTKWIYGAYPYSDIDEKGDYPLVVVNDPIYSWEQLTLKKYWVPFKIDIEIYTSNSAQCATISDSVINAIESRKMTSLSDDLITLVEVDNIMPSFFMRGKIKVHVKVITFTGKVVIDKT